MVFLIEMLNFEEFIMFVLILIVLDGKGGVSDIILIVEVIDYNDLFIFVNILFSVVIDENISIGI